MPKVNLAELSDAAAEADAPRFAVSRRAESGGVDPLGLRQINFDLMDQVLPGINNVGRHLRPFVVTTWAWRRAAILGVVAGHANLPTDLLRDFVDRIEVLYAWSHFLHGKADLPGGDVLASLVHQAFYHFGGTEWKTRRDVRSRSTGFMAAINYGPALRTLGWIEPDPKGSGAMRAVHSKPIQAALDAFERCIADHLKHPAFSQLGDINVSANDARAFYDDWSMQQPTEEERAAMREALAGASSSPARSAGIALMLSARSASDNDLVPLRRRMCEPPPASSPPLPGVEPPRLAWRRLQVRQAFRFALESLLHWIVLTLAPSRSRSARTLSTSALVKAFHDEIPDRLGRTTAESWFAETTHKNPVDAMEAISVAAAVPGATQLPEAIADVLAFCLKEAPKQPEGFEAADRLPLARARREMVAWKDAPAGDFLRHVFESWVLAQHVYWSAGRGLADARAGGKTLLRLRVVLEEAGWTLAPGIKPSGLPNPTADRLATAMTLGRECGLIQTTDGNPPVFAAD